MTNSQNTIEQLIRTCWFHSVICDDEKLRFYALFLANPTLRSVFYLHLVQLMSQSHPVSVTWSLPQVNLKTGHAPLLRWVHQNAQSKEEETHLWPGLKPGEIHEFCLWKNNSMSTAVVCLAESHLIGPQVISLRICDINARRCALRCFA